MRNLICLAMLLTTSCVIRHETFTAQPSKSGQAMPVPLRMDGVYYTTYQPPGYSYLFFQYLFLYRNGIAVEVDYTLSDTVTVDPDAVRRIITRDLAEPSQSHVVPFYGGCSFARDTLYIQNMRYYPSDHWENTTLKGRVINDSTVYISDFVFPPRPQAMHPPFYLHFLPMNKPDSLARNPWKRSRWYWKE